MEQEMKHHEYQQASHKSRNAILEASCGFGRATSHRKYEFSSHMSGCRRRRSAAIKWDTIKAWGNEIRDIEVKKQWFHCLHDITSVYTSLLFWYTWYVCIEKYHNVSFTGLLQINSLNPQSLASAETVASSSPIPASNTENSGAYRSTGGRENDLHHLSV